MYGKTSAHEPETNAPPAMCQSVTKNHLVDFLNKGQDGKYIFMDRPGSRIDRSGPFTDQLCRPYRFRSAGCLFQDHHRGRGTGRRGSRTYTGTEKSEG